jgi:hypothetical protein
LDSGAALAIDAKAVAIAPARSVELTTVLTDIGVSPNGFAIVPGLDTTPLRSARNRCYSGRSHDHQLFVTENTGHQARHLAIRTHIEYRVLPRPAKEFRSGETQEPAAL